MFLHPCWNRMRSTRFRPMAAHPARDRAADSANATQPRTLQAVVANEFAYSAVCHPTPPAATPGWRAGVRSARPLRTTHSNMLTDVVCCLAIADAERLRRSGTSFTNWREIVTGDRCFDTVGVEIGSLWDQPPLFPSDDAFLSSQTARLTRPLNGLHGPP